MNTVGLHHACQSFCAIHTVDQPGQKTAGIKRAVFFRQFRIHAVERRLVIGSVIARGLEPDQQHVHSGSLGLGKDAVEIGAARFGRNGTEQIIPAKGHNQRIHLRRERPIYAAQSTCCRITGHTGIKDNYVVTPFPKPGFKLRNEAVFLRQAIALGQAVTKSSNGYRFRPCRYAECNRSKSRSACLAEPRPSPISQ